jgi:hypothetical protein
VLIRDEKLVFMQDYAYGGSWEWHRPVIKGDHTREAKEIFLCLTAVVQGRPKTFFVFMGDHAREVKNVFCE